MPLLFLPPDERLDVTSDFSGGAIVGGLIIGAGEKLSEVFLAPILVKAFDLAGGGIENWFAYMLALVFLLFRPQGLFGERIIERV